MSVQVRALRKFPAKPLAIGGAVVAVGALAMFLMTLPKQASNGVDSVVRDSAGAAPVAPVAPVLPASRTFSSVTLLINNRAATSQLTLRKGQQVAISARAVGSDGTDSILSVRSSNGAVLSVARGYLVAKTAGVAEIIATAPGVDGRVVVTVQEAPVVASGGVTTAATIAAADLARLATQTTVAPSPGLVAPVATVVADKSVSDSVAKPALLPADSPVKSPAPASYTSDDFSSTVLKWLVENRDAFRVNDDLARRMKKLDFWNFGQEGGFRVLSVTGIAGGNATVLVRFPSTDASGALGFVTATFRVRIDGKMVANAAVVGRVEFQLKAP
jgi:hypothetical protein